MNDKNDDTTYDLIASVNHQIQPNGGGHYYAICRQNISGRWYKYDDESVTVADFTKRNKVCTVKIGYQRAATILFYIRRSKPPSSVKMSILSDNDEDKESTHENSLQSRYSDILKMERTMIALTLTQRTLMREVMSGVIQHRPG